MKKIISLLLSVIMIFSLLSVSVSAAETEFKISVANDLHYNLDAVSSSEGRYADKDFSNATMSGALRVESGAIIDAFLDAAASNGSDAVLIPGDLADTGATDEQYPIAAKFAAFEEKTGKQIYVVPGNHDYARTTPEQFKEIYYQFGYAEAIAYDSLSASYVADIGDDFRLIAIDSCDYKVGGCSITAERVKWIKSQAEKAKADGKNTIAMMHHNLLNHFMLGDILFKGAYVDPALGLAEIFAENSVKYNFTGHTHSQDIKAYTGKNGVTVYDVLTSSINTYPCPYRVVTFGERTKIRTEHITDIDTSCLKGIITENCYNLATENFAQYAKTCLDYGYSDVADSYLTAAKIKSILGVTAENNPEMYALVDKLMPEVREIFFMPIYEEDETEIGKSIESLSKKFGITVPETEYKTFAELFIVFYQSYTFGDESHGVLSPEYSLMVASVSVLLNQILSDVTAEEYALVLSFLCGFFGIDKLPSFFLDFSANGISRAKGIDFLVTSVISTVALGFTTDEAPADNNVSLDGYGEVQTEKESLTFWDKVIDFFIKAFSFILRFFSFG